MSLELQQRRQCQVIIHSAAAGAGAGNLLPVPGAGIAADMLAMTAMCIALAAVFGRDLESHVAKGMAVSALKQSMLKQPIKVLSKELSKLIPGLGQVVAPAVSAGLIEAAGWILVKEFEQSSALARPGFDL